MKRYALLCTLCLFLVLTAMPAHAQEVLLRLYVVRHAEAYNNVDHPSDWTDDQIDRLTPLGEKQAQAIAAKLGDAHIAAIFTSPLHRTRQTADAVALALGQGTPHRGALSLNVLVVPQTSLGLASLDGRVSWEEREKNWEQGRDPRPPGGESLHDAWIRVHTFVDSLLPAYRGKSVVLVTHGEIISMLVAQATHVPLLECFKKIAVARASVTVIEIRSDGWTLISLGK